MVDQLQCDSCGRLLAAEADFGQTLLAQTAYDSLFVLCLCVFSNLVFFLSSFFKVSRCL